MLFPCQVRPEGDVRGVQVRHISQLRDLSDNRVLINRVW